MPGQTTLTQPRRRDRVDGLGIPVGEMPGHTIAPAEAPAGLSLLYLLNVSNPGRLSADSGLLFADILAPALLDRGVRFTVAGPVGLSDPRAGHIEVSAPTTKYRARFGFDVDACAALVRLARPEVVAANQIEAAPGIRAAMLEAGSDALLAGYCHYLPFHVDRAGRMHLDPSLSDADLGHPVLLAVAAGLMACDRVMVHSAVARTWLHLLAERLRLDLGDRVRVVPPPADPRLLQSASRVAPPQAAPVGVYNHRLYEHYGTGQFVDLARQLRDAVPVRLRVMDLFGTRRTDRTRLDASPERYRSLLAALANVEVVSPTTVTGSVTGICSAVPCSVSRRSGPAVRGRCRSSTAWAWACRCLRLGWAGWRRSRTRNSPSTTRTRPWASSAGWCQIRVSPSRPASGRCAASRISLRTSLPTPT